MELSKILENFTAEYQSKEQQLTEKDQQLTELKKQNEELVAKIENLAKENEAKAKQTDEMLAKFAILEKEAAENREFKIKHYTEHYKNQLQTTGKLDEKFDDFIESIKNDKVFNVLFQTELAGIISQFGHDVSYNHLGYDSCSVFKDGFVRLFDGGESAQTYQYEHPIFAIPTKLVNFISGTIRCISAVSRRVMIYLAYVEGNVYLYFLDTPRAYRLKLRQYKLNNRKNLEDLMEMRKIIDEYNKETVEFLKKEQKTFWQFVEGLQH